VLCISAILCFVYVFVCFYCSRPIFCNRRVSNHLASVDVSAGNSLSTPQYSDRTFVITVLLIMFSLFPFTEINVCMYEVSRYIRVLS